MTTKGHGHIRNPDPFSLTPKEKRVIEMLADGASREDVCAALSFTHYALSSHLAHIRDKLLCDTVEQAIAKLKAKPKR